MRARRCSAIVMIGSVSLALGVLALAAIAAEQPKQMVLVRGSDTMCNLITTYANEFLTANPQCEVMVSGGPSRVGIEAVLGGETDVGMSSVRASKEEVNEAQKNGINLVEAVVGWGAIVIITHPSNPVNVLTVEQVRKLLTGEFSSWGRVGGPEKPVVVVAVTEEARAGTFRFMTDEFMSANFSPGARMLSYFRSVPPTVAETEGAIGVIRMRNLERLREQGVDKKIKVLAIKKEESSPAVTPTRESIDDGQYAITRPYLLYLNGSKASKCAADFFKFCEERNPRPNDKLSPVSANR